MQQYVHVDNLIKCSIKSSASFKTITFDLQVNGFFSIVIVDVYQSLFMFAAFIYVAVLGSQVVLPDHFNIFVPATNGSFISVGAFSSKIFSKLITIAIIIHKQLLRLRCRGTGGGTWRLR